MSVTSHHISYYICIFLAILNKYSIEDLVNTVMSESWQITAAVLIIIDIGSLLIYVVDHV